MNRKWCVSVGVDLPLGVLAVNSGSKQNVSSGFPAAGLNGGWSSLLYSFWRKHRYTHTHILEIKPYLRPFGVCELMWSWSQDPSQINPLQSLSSSAQPIASCWFLNTHTELLVHTQWELALSPDTQTWLAWPRLMTSSHQANRLRGVNPQQKLGELYASVCVGLWEMRARCACAHIPVDGGKESVAFDLLHSIGSGPWRHRSLWFS